MVCALQLAATTPATKKTQHKLLRTTSGGEEIGEGEEKSAAGGKNFHFGRDLEGLESGFASV